MARPWRKPMSDGKGRNRYGDWQEVVRQNHNLRTTLGMKRISVLLVSHINMCLNNSDQILCGFPSRIPSRVEHAGRLVDL